MGVGACAAAQEPTATRHSNALRGRARMVVNKRWRMADTKLSSSSWPLKACYSKRALSNVGATTGGCIYKRAHAAVTRSRWPGRPPGPARSLGANKLRLQTQNITVVPVSTHWFTVWCSGQVPGARTLLAS